jgi:DNA-binding transcriptional ArsR family regulator
MAPDLLSTIRREIDERLSELRPRLAEYEQLLVAADALVTTGGGAVTETIPEIVHEPKQVASAKPKPARAVPGAAREAILAALDHGSHTVGELAVVTAMSAPNINGNLRRLAAEGAVVKTEREGKSAWALPGA